MSGLKNQDEQNIQLPILSYFNLILSTFQNLIENIVKTISKNNSYMFSIVKIYIIFFKNNNIETF